VLAGAAYVFREELADRWHIWQLSSGDVGTRKRALERLWRRGRVEAVQHRIEELVRDRSIRAMEGDRVQVRFGKGGFELPSRCTVDLEEGVDHGGSLCFQRLWIEGERVDAEEVHWHQTSMSPFPKVVTIRRGRLEPRPSRLLRETLRLIPAVVLSEDKAPRWTVNSDGSGSFSDPSVIPTSRFFSLFRVIGPEGDVLLEKRFGGHGGSDSQHEYLPLLALQEIAQDLVLEADLEEVAHDRLGTSHFPDAHRRNLPFLDGEDYSWVRDRSQDVLRALSLKD